MWNFFEPIFVYLLAVENIQSKINRVLFHTNSIAIQRCETKNIFPIGKWDKRLIKSKEINTTYREILKNDFSLSTLKKINLIAHEENNAKR